MNKKIALAFLIASFLVGDAYGMTAGEWATKYKKPASSQEVAILLAYIKGASEGVQWMDTEMELEDKGNFFCISDNIALTLKQRVSMFKNYSYFSGRWIVFDCVFIILCWWSSAFACTLDR